PRCMRNLISAYWATPLMDDGHAATTWSLVLMIPATLCASSMNNSDLRHWAGRPRHRLRPDP
ncbi:MAG: hypothetical protein WCC08_16060, partial [Terrimicrobiaceae bacterium]